MMMYTSKYNTFGGQGLIKTHGNGRKAALKQTLGRNERRRRRYTCQQRHSLQLMGRLRVSSVFLSLRYVLFSVIAACSLFVRG